MVFIHPKSRWPLGSAVGLPYRAGAEAPGLSFVGWTHCGSLPNHLEMSKCMSAGTRAVPVSPWALRVLGWFLNF